VPGWHLPLPSQQPLGQLHPALVPHDPPAHFPPWSAQTWHLAPPVPHAQSESPAWQLPKRSVQPAHDGDDLQACVCASQVPPLVVQFTQVAAPPPQASSAVPG